MNPSGQIAIVTGGGSGLGEATARALAAKGAKVAVFDVGMERAEKVAAEKERARSERAPCHSQYITHRGACGKTPAVPHRRRP